MENYYYRYDLSAKDYRVKASKQCNRASNLILTYFVYLLIIVAVGVIDNLTGSKEMVNGVEKTSTWFASLFNFVTGAAFAFSFAEIASKVTYCQNVEISDLFSGFSYYKYGRAFLLFLLQELYVFLWSLLFIIPGIIKGFSYSMAHFIANENPSLTLNDCLKKSQEMMDGYKWKYFSCRFNRF